MISTRFWHDSWVRGLNALDRYLFLYFMTNDKCSFCGIYELPIEVIAFETGIDEHDLQKSMIPRLEPKVYYHQGWVCLPNFKKHHVSEKSKNSKTGYDSALEEVPKYVLDYFQRISLMEISPFKPLISPSDTSASAFASTLTSTSASREQDTASKEAKGRTNTNGPIPISELIELIKDL